MLLYEKYLYWQIDTQKVLVPFPLTRKETHVYLHSEVTTQCLWFLIQATKYLWTIYYVAGTLLGSGDSEQNKQNSTPSWCLYFSGER